MVKTWLCHSITICHSVRPRTTSTHTFVKCAIILYIFFSHSHNPFYFNPPSQFNPTRRLLLSSSCCIWNKNLLLLLFNIVYLFPSRMAHRTEALELNVASYRAMRNETETEANVRIYSPSMRWTTIFTKLSSVYQLVRIYSSLW